VEPLTISFRIARCPRLGPKEDSSLNRRKKCRSVGSALSADTVAPDARIGMIARAILVVQPFMGKYKASKPKSTAPPTMKPGVPCLVFLVLGMILTMFLLYEVMKNAS
jgi:hypothetical protein